MEANALTSQLSPRSPCPSTADHPSLAEFPVTRHFTTVEVKITSDSGAGYVLQPHAVPWRQRAESPRGTTTSALEVPVAGAATGCSKRTCGSSTDPWSLGNHRATPRYRNCLEAKREAVQDIPRTTLPKMKKVYGWDMLADAPGDHVEFAMDHVLGTIPTRPRAAPRDGRRLVSGGATNAARAWTGFSADSTSQVVS